MPRFTNLTPDSCSEPEYEPSGHAEFQLREAMNSIAKEDSYEGKMEKLRAEVTKKFSDNAGGPMASYESSAFVEQTYDDCVIYRKGGKLYKVYFEWEDGEIEFDEPKEVRQTYTEVKESQVVPLENIYKKKKKKTKNGYVLEPVAGGYAGSPGARTNPAG